MRFLRTRKTTKGIRQGRTQKIPPELLTAMANPKQRGAVFNIWVASDCDWGRAAAVIKKYHKTWTKMRGVERWMTLHQLENISTTRRWPSMYPGRRRPDLTNSFPKLTRLQQRKTRSTWWKSSTNKKRVKNMALMLRPLSRESSGRTTQKLPISSTLSILLRGTARASHHHGISRTEKAEKKGG